MKRRIFAGVLAVAAPGWAEDSISAMGAYYYEYEARNTRVVMPSIELKKDLPAEADLSAYFLVDQITSASAAFQGGADAVYQEYREELGVAFHKRWGQVTPGLSYRISYEPDYQSQTLGFETTLGLRQDTTRVRLQGQIQEDTVKKRGVPSFNEELDAVMGGIHVVQVLRRDLQTGAGVEVSQLDGFQSNPYRRCGSGTLEAHPERRRRVAAFGWGAFHLRPTRTTLYAGYRFYDDNWAVRAHTGEVRVTQRILAPLELEAYWRPYTQTAVYFINERPDRQYCTGDPKLSAFDAHFVEGVVRVSIPPFWFLREPRLEAAMGYLTQNSTQNSGEPAGEREGAPPPSIEDRYGDAVLARLGGSFAF